MNRDGVSIVILCVFLLLQSCVNATVTGAQAAYNRHSIKAAINDHYTAMMIDRKIYLDTDRFKNTNITSTSFNNVILLAGQVPYPQQKIEIEKIVRNISDNDEIHNLITVSTPSSALTRVSDAWITAKIKAKLIAMDDIEPDLFKVVTENGVVYLMGIVPHDQADIAIDIARKTDGVQQVVTVFKYLRISKV